MLAFSRVTDATIAAGTTVAWIDSFDVFGAAVDNTTHSLTYYLRRNAPSGGVTLLALRITLDGK